MPYNVIVRDVLAKSLRLQDTSEKQPDPSPNEDEIYAFGFVLVTDKDGDERGLFPIRKSAPVAFAANNEEHYLESSGIRFQKTVNSGVLFHTYMFLMEEDTGAVADDVGEAIRGLVEKVLPEAKKINFVDAILEGAQVDSTLLFVGSFVDWFLSTFNSDDFIGRTECRTIDATNLRGTVRIPVSETLEGANAKYRFQYNVEVTAI
jgi:hypothetical protein